MDKIDRIKQHFEQEATDYDTVIAKYVPHYFEFLDAMMLSILKDRNDTIKVLDLGCGTGNVSLAVKKSFPNAQITCVDIADNMLKETSKKLSAYADVKYCKSDVRDFDFSDKYDVALAQLALHHIDDPEEKKGFFRKVYGALSEGGHFIISDVILGATDNLQKMYIEKWVADMKKRLPNEEVNYVLDVYHKEDSPFRLVDELKWMKEAGFTEVDVVCKYYNDAVYLGIK